MQKKSTSDFSSPHIKRHALNNYRLPDETHIGYVNLQVSDLRTASYFYQDLLGFKKAAGLGDSLVLSASGVSPYQILLTERRDARPKPMRSTGLYHVAVRYPNRRELARAFRRLYSNNVMFQGFSDHLVSEAIYLADPDGNGIELYVDRPRAQWKMLERQIEMGSLPLDMDNLMRELAGDAGEDESIHPQTDIGHVHLHVSDLGKAEEFYHRVIGFDITQRSYPGALFLSAGGYHHHIGVNVWAGKGAPPPPPDAVGLLSVGIVLPDRNSMDALRKQFQAEGRPFIDKRHEKIQTEVLQIKDPDGTVLDFFLANK